MIPSRHSVPMTLSMLMMKRPKIFWILGILSRDASLALVICLALSFILKCSLIFSVLVFKVYISWKKIQYKNILTLSNSNPMPIMSIKLSLIYGIFFMELSMERSWKIALFGKKAMPIALLWILITSLLFQWKIP